jgi:hypothetical protein
MSEFTEQPVLRGWYQRPKVQITTTFRDGVLYAPSEMQVDIDTDDVSAADIVAVLNAMAYVAYGPLSTPDSPAGLNGQQSLMP